MHLFMAIKFKKNLKVENDLIVKWYFAWYLVFYFSIWMKSNVWKVKSLHEVDKMKFILEW